VSNSKQKKSIAAVMVNMCETLNLITAALKDHEQRLVLLEGPQLKEELKELKKKVSLISDPEKRLQASNALKGIFDLFGIPDLESLEK
jgi:hypothetical protein